MASYGKSYGMVFGGLAVFGGTGTEQLVRLALNRRPHNRLHVSSSVLALGTSGQGAYQSGVVG